MACRSRRTLDSLRGLFEGFIGSPTPVTVAFFSASMVGPNEQVVRSEQSVATCALLPKPSARSAPPRRTPGAALHHRAGRYGQPGCRPRHLAGVTGGVRLALGGVDDNAFTRMLRETSAFYRVAFEPEPSQRNGSVQRIELQGLAARRHDARAPVAAHRSRRRQGRARAPKDLLRQTAIKRDLPLRVTGFASRQSGQKKLKVVAVAEPIDPATELASAALGLIDGNGKLVAQAPFEAADLKPGQPVMAAMLVPPGSYRLRVAADR